MLWFDLTNCHLFCKFFDSKKLRHTFYTYNLFTCSMDPSGPVHKLLHYFPLVACLTCSLIGKDAYDYIAPTCDYKCLNQWNYYMFFCCDLFKNPLCLVDLLFQSEEAGRSVCGQNWIVWVSAHTSGITFNSIIILPIFEELVALWDKKAINNTRLIIKKSISCHAFCLKWSTDQLKIG